MTRHHRVLAGAVLAISTAAGAAAYAQVGSGPQPQPSIERGERPGHHERMVVIRRSDERPDQAEHLRAILQLKPTQEPALAAYLDAMHPNVDRDRIVKMGAEGRPKTTPEKLARVEARMNERQATVKTQIAATKRFYDQLDPAQKRAFDELPLMMGGPPMPMMGGMKIMHRPGPPMPPMAPTPPAPPRS